MSEGRLWLVLLVAVVVLLGWYLTLTAARLDRLHARVEGARAALDAQLVRRGAVALELAASGLLDPASSMLVAHAAHSARSATEDARELAESDLSNALRAALSPEAVAELTDDVVGRELVADLASASQRVTLARRFHNDAVSAAVRVRRRRALRLLRLAGHAPLPTTFEFDDRPPEALAR